MNRGTPEQVEAIMAWAEMEMVEEADFAETDRRDAIGDKMEKVLGAYSFPEAMCKAGEILAAEVRALRAELAEAKKPIDGKAIAEAYLNEPACCAGRSEDACNCRGTTRLQEIIYSELEGRHINAEKLLNETGYALAQYRDKAISLAESCSTDEEDEIAELDQKYGDLVERAESQIRAAIDAAKGGTK